MKAEADALIAAVVDYGDHPSAIRRLSNVRSLRTALGHGGPVTVDITAADDSPEAAALETAVRAVEKAIVGNPEAARYVTTRLLEVWPSSVARPAAGWLDEWEAS